MTTALITGASSGLGAEYARQLAVVAQEIADAGGPEAELLAADLLSDAGLAAAMARLSDPDRPIDILVNNAGFGLPLAFEKNDIEAEMRHLKLHNEVPLRLMHAALQGMLARRSGRILNVASVAAFIPRSTYSAVKRSIVVFSRWANGRYRSRGVVVTAVCPGFTHTNFHERLGMPPGEEGIPRWMWLDAAQVVAESIRDLDRGRPLSIPSLRYKLLARLARLAPPSLAARIGERGRSENGI